MWRGYMIVGITFCVLIGVCIFLFVAIQLIERRLAMIEEIIVNELSQNVHTKLQPPKNIESEIAAGLIKGIKQLRTDDENHLKLLSLARKAQQTAMPVMNSNSVGQEFINTGGDLIPSNLTKEEREILKMWHET